MNEGRKMKGRKWNITVVLLIVLITVLLLAGTALGTYAAYTSSRSAQRTIATYDEQGERFSSNILVRGYSKDNVKTLYVTDPTIAPSQLITICNYERGKQNLPYSEQIGYTLLARFVKYEANTTEKYVPVDAEYMTANELTGYTATLRIGENVVTLSASHLSDNSFSGQLTANVSDSDSYTLTYDTSFAVNRPNLYVEMIVTPTNVGLHTLCGVFKADVRVQGATNSWTGSFSDDTTSAPSAYDGFNYSVTGVGDGTVTLTWDDSKVDLSYYSVQILMAIEGATKTGSSITFPVDSDEESRYDLQFYKVSISSETWTDMNTTVVRFRFA